MKKLDISPDLSSFLGLEPGEKISRVEVNRAITAYIHVNDINDPEMNPNKRKWVDKLNPGGLRSLQDPNNKSVIVPDQKLSDLLDYPAYKKQVENGEKTWKRRNRTTVDFIEIVETDPKLTYSVLQHLIVPHFNKDCWNKFKSAKYFKIVDFANKLSLFLNGRLQFDYVRMEILESHPKSKHFKTHQLLQIVTPERV
jgi:uncharacterized protein (DUF736 family)